MSATTIRVEFGSGPVLLPLAIRNEMFRDAVLKFEPRPAVLLLRTGYMPLPLNEATDADVMFAEAVQITGKLKPMQPLIVE